MIWKRESERAYDMPSNSSLIHFCHTDFFSKSFPKWVERFEMDQWISLLMYDPIKHQPLTILTS